MAIGLLPCAGAATRIHGIPKALLPVNEGYLLGIHVDAMQATGVQAIIGTTTENSSLLHRYSKSGFVYTVDHYATMSETILSCKGFTTIDGVVAEDVLFGMPDTYLEDDLCYPKLLTALDNGAQVAVALFRARKGQHLKAGMCDTRGNQVVEVIDKPAETTFTRLWGALAWKPEFWQFIQPADPHVGYALPRAIAAGMDVRAVRMDGGYWDCGTTAEYFDLVTHLHGRKEPAEMQQVYG